MIRVATQSERDKIYSLHLSAFPKGENALVATLATGLLGDTTEPEAISLVYETDDQLVGHVAFSPVTTDVDKNWLGYLLAPLGVLPEYQKRGIGSQLVKRGIQRLSADGVNALFVYGDPAYYGRFGFSAESAARFSPPYDLQYPFGWQALLLREDDLDQQPARLTCVASLRDPALW